MPEPSEQEVMDAYIKTADSFGEALVASCLADDGQTAVDIVTHMYEHQDFHLTLVTITSLVHKLVEARVRASEAHGPLWRRPEGVEEAQPTPFQTATYDQMDAAAQNNDYATFGRLALQGQLRALGEDTREYTVDFDHILRGVMLMDQQSMALMLTQALVTLHLQRGPHDDE